MKDSVIWIKNELQALDGKLDVNSTENLQLLKSQLCDIHESLQMLNDLVQAKKQLIEENSWDVFVACASQDQQQVDVLMNKLERHYGVKCTSSCHLAQFEWYKIENAIILSRYIVVMPSVDFLLDDDVCRWMSLSISDI